MQDEKSASQVPPIDVFWVKGNQGGNYYIHLVAAIGMLLVMIHLAEMN
jgi:hypothetical protein